MARQAVARLGRSAILVCAVAAACGRSTPPPIVDPVETINGTERIAWTQPAADAGELATFHYAIYIDGSRSELSGASCSHVSSTADFTCVAPLPSMSAGAHTLELATFTADEGVLESARSGPLRVTLTTATTSGTPSAAPWPAMLSVATTDRLTLRLEQIGDDFVDPTDFAFLPDGRLLVAERAGRIRVVRDGRVLHDAALSPPPGASDLDHLLALAVDPRFDRTRFVYAIDTASSPAGSPAFRLLRYREASNTLADRVVLLDGIPASPAGASAAVRFGADGKLFAAFDDGGSPRLAGDLASPNGKILRLNSDGTTPDDQPGGTPLYSYPYRAPAGFDWHSTSRLFWIADRDAPGSGRLSVVTGSPTRIRGVIRSAFALPRGTVPSSMAFYHGDLIPRFRENLLIASDEGRHLLRIQIDPLQPTHVVATERLLQDRIGGIRVVGVAPGGAIYVGTAQAVGRLSPMDR